MKAIYAKLTHPDNGYSSDVEMVKSLSTLCTYRLAGAEVGRSYTSIQLEGVSGSFNSVQFDFYDTHGDPVDIYNMPEFNSYLPFTESPDEGV